mgnify:CR=1 FL=1
MNLGEYIKEYRQEHGVSQRGFAAISGLTNGYISMLENNKHPKTGEPIAPTLETYKKVAVATGLSFDDLIAMIDDNIVLNARPETAARGVFGLPALRRVPRVGSIACGEPILAEQNIESYDAVPDFVNCDFTLVCKGDSMINARICDGDIVCIKQQPEVENGQIAAVQVGEDSATLKRVRYLDGGIALWPENPAYAPMIFTGDDVSKIRILGLATHFISRCI